MNWKTEEEKRKRYAAQQTGSGQVKAPENLNLSDVDRANRALQEHIGGGYQYGNQAALDSAYEKWLNRGDFEFDISRDPFFQQYKDQYSALGKLAMEDTVGQVSALTGGYANSYAQTAGQQAYNQYMQQLNGIMPEVYSMSRGNYDAEGQQLLNEISMLESQKANDYNQWRDWLSYLQSDAQYKQQLELAKSSGGGSGGSGGSSATEETKHILDTVPKSVMDELKDVAAVGDMDELDRRIAQMLGTILTEDQAIALEDFFGVSEISGGGGFLSKLWGGLSGLFN